MVTVLINERAGAWGYRQHPDADGFSVTDSVLYVMRGTEALAAYPLSSVAGVERGKATPVKEEPCPKK